MAAQSTTELLRRAVDGDQTAWNEVVDRYAALVWSVVRGFRLGDEASADVAQMVWFRLAENVSTIRDPERLAAWLATTARRESLRMVKDRQRNVPTDFVHDLTDPSVPTTDERIESDETLTEALTAFAQLDESCQELLRLCCVTPPLSYEEIAEILDRPIGSIGPTRARCLEKLRAHLPGDLESEES